MAVCGKPSRLKVRYLEFYLVSLFSVLSLFLILSYFTVTFLYLLFPWLSLSLGVIQGLLLSLLQSVPLDLNSQIVALGASSEAHLFFARIPNILFDFFLS